MSRLKQLTVWTKEVSTSRAACTPAVFKIFEVLGYECELQPFFVLNGMEWPSLLGSLAKQTCVDNARFCNT